MSLSLRVIKGVDVAARNTPTLGAARPRSYIGSRVDSSAAELFEAISQSMYRFKRVNQIAMWLEK